MAKTKQKYFILVISVLFFIILCKFHNTSHFTIGCCSSQCQQKIENYVENYLDISEREINFDKDMLALLHIQKTSGSFWERSILSYLQIKRNGVWEKACNFNKVAKRTICLKNRHKKSFFWDRYMARFCDIHADYTELKNCIMFDYSNRIRMPSHKIPFYGIIHFMTMLRNPIDRYISEFHHVKKGATWERAVRVCTEELLFKRNCSSGKTWMNATWSEFLSCDYNLANNRQTRMLANYNQLGCRILKCWTKEGNCSDENKRLYGKRIVESAKQTLLSISFFGLTEYESLSQYLFEKIFNDQMKFSKPLNDTKTVNYELSEEYQSLDLIKQNNQLDIELYKFAKNLFFKRVKYFQEMDNKAVTNGKMD